MKPRIVFAFALVSAGVLLSATPASAQIQVGTKVGAPPPVMSGTYDSLGRRDPFLTLITPRRGSTPTTSITRAAQGLGSFMLADVVVTGITRKGDLMMAILQGVDKQSYVVKVKDRLADAVIKSIDSTGVVFVDIAEPGGTGRPQETRKMLRSAAEVNR